MPTPKEIHPIVRDRKTIFAQKEEILRLRYEKKLAERKASQTIMGLTTENMELRDRLNSALYGNDWRERLHIAMELDKAEKRDWKPLP